MRRLLCVSLLLLIGSAQASPISYGWSGTIQTVYEDSGTTVFSGTAAGDPFSGSWVYDTEPGTVVIDTDQTCDAALCEWAWSGPGNVTGQIANDSPPPARKTISVGPVGNTFLIQENDQNLSENPDDLDLINSILEPDIEVDTPFDLWELSSDLETSDGLIFFGVTYITTDTSAIADASVFDSTPPFALTPAAGRAAIFAIQEVSTSGEFFAIGTLTSAAITPIPVPAAVWLFGSGLVVVGWATRRSRRGD